MSSHVAGLIQLLSGRRHPLVEDLRDARLGNRTTAFHHEESGVRMHKVGYQVPSDEVDLDVDFTVFDLVDVVEHHAEVLSTSRPIRNHLLIITAHEHSCRSEERPRWRPSNATTVARRTPRYVRKRERFIKPAHHDTSQIPDSSRLNSESWLSST